MKKLVGYLVALAIAVGAYLYLGSQAAHAETCSTRTTHYQGHTASGTGEATVTVTRTCGDVRVVGFKGRYAYVSGERATVTRSERYDREGSRWVRVAEHSFRSARYATGRVTVTEVWIRGCAKTEEVDTSTPKGTYSQRITDSRVC
jgi:hypothetical protein